MRPARVGGRRPRGEDHGPDASFDGCEPVLQDVVGRVVQPGIDEAELRQREEVRRVVGVFEDVGGRLVDRHRPGACRLGRVVSCVKDFRC